MFTTGNKLLIGSAVLAALFATVYGVTQEGTLGIIGLASAAVALSFLAGINIFTRDANVGVDEAGAATVSAAAQQAPAGSPWPVVAALGVTVALLGLVTYPAITIIGLVVLLAGATEWMVQAWAERGSADAGYNNEIRARIANPLEMPVLASIFAALIIYGFSRVMLSLTKTGTVVAFSVLATLVLFIAFLIAARPKVSSGTIGGLVALALFALVTGGAVAGLTGERDIYVIETTADLAERGRCGPEASQADKRASQTVAAKSSVAATITLRADETLTVEVPGFNKDATALTLPRSNPNNILFRNETPHERRLVIDAGPAGPDDEPRVLCTALVEQDAVQLLTVTFDKPSFVTEDGHRFYVPGVETAELEVTVP
jgi:hypothetical protein